MRRIPLLFITTRVRLTWFQLLVGLREDWLSRTDAIEFARVEVNSGNRDDLILKLASLPPEESVEVVPTLIELSRREQQDEQKARHLWMKILLAWSYENRNQFDDPLSVVETLYADFGYPPEIRHLVRFNPPVDEYRPEGHGREESTQWLMDLWKSYIDDVLPETREFNPRNDR